jgi:hypothetical protein
MRELARDTTRVKTELQSITTAAGAMTAAITEGAAMMDASLTGALATARALTAQLAAAGRAGAAAGRSVVLPGGGGGGRHGPAPGAGGGGFHVSSLSTRIPGGHAHFRGGGNAAMAGAGALAYGVYEEAEVEDIAARAMITGQIKVDAGMNRGEVFKQLRSVITRNAISGGFSPKEVGEAVLGSERQFAGLPFNERMAVLDTMLPYAMQEARLKETPLKESAEALVGLSHMTGTYDPAKLPDLYRKFAYASQLTPKTLTQYTTALSYAMPSLVGGMGMDPTSIMFLTAMNQQAGIGSSKAGTWIQAFFSKLMPATGDHLTKTQLHHNEALEGLGLVAGGVPTWMVTGEGGKTDWQASLLKLSPLLGKNLAALPDAQRMQTLDTVFGKQGGREAGLFNLPEFIAQFPRLSQQMQSAAGGEDVLGAYGKASPVQQARTAFSELTVVLMELATVVLPPLTESLKTVSGILKAIRETMPAQGQIGGVPNPGTLGDALKRGMSKGLVPGGVVGGLASLVTAGTSAWATIPLGMAVGALTYGAAEGGQYLWNKATTGLGAANAGIATLPPGTVPGQGSPVIVKADITMNVPEGTDDVKGLANRVLIEINRQIAQGHTHNLGEADSVASSPYATGAALP